MDATHAFLDTQLHYIEYRMRTLLSEGRDADATRYLEARLARFGEHLGRDERLYVEFRAGTLRRLLPAAAAIEPHTAAAAAVGTLSAVA